MAKIYKYMNAMSDKIQEIDVDLDQVQEEIDKLNSDIRIVIPLETSYVTTKFIRISLGNEITENKSYLNKIVLKDDKGNDLYKGGKIAAIRSFYPYEGFKDLDKLLNNEPNQTLYACRHNPCLIQIEFKEEVNVGEIWFSTKEFNSLGIVSAFQSLDVEYMDMVKGGWYYIETRREAFHPEFGEYNVDFSLIEGKRYVLDGGDKSIMTLEEVNRILQNYVRRDEIEELFQKNFGKMALAVKSAVLNDISNLRNCKK